jgi:hypothetical protein
MSDPAAHIGIVAGLPSDVGTLNRIIQGLLVHSDWLGAYGLDGGDHRGVSRDTLPVADRLDEILANSSKNLEDPRSPGKRSVATCRDFPLCCVPFCAARIPRRGYVVASPTISARLGKTIGFANIGTGKLGSGA